ncbi:isochorismatase family protein [Corynebacterium uterequi]|uniref:nicotinamidase n=1 Tax=Corynebacterium uterequi TaxID=1072256 RepID=A0A0G3HG63_9CORY|nr:isochorismatase family protein [Corynebacterium uterequi]AKK11735.1 nicotinamidase-like amidase [Corynebacterium uterequi]
MTRPTLIVVDVQNDFCHGSLATERGGAVASLISDHLAAHRERYEHVVVTKDWHIDPGEHFSPEPDYVDTWPVHCVAGSDGAALHDALADLRPDAVFTKGEYSAAYSGFEGSSNSVSLAAWLRERGVTDLVVCGIATDHCVRATAADGLREGFAVTVLTHLCAPVSEERGAQALKELAAAGAQVQP